MRNVYSYMPISCKFRSYVGRLHPDICVPLFNTTVKSFAYSNNTLTQEDTIKTLQKFQLLITVLPDKTNNSILVLYCGIYQRSFKSELD